MPVTIFKRALRLLENAGIEMDSPHPVFASEINECEKQLGFLLPISYKQFLLDYGFGGAEDIVFYGLIHGDLWKNSYINAFLFTLDLRKENNFPNNLFAFENFDGDGVACFLLSDLKDGECPVIFWDHSEEIEAQLRNPCILTSSFGEYFYKRTLELVAQNQENQGENQGKSRENQENQENQGVSQLDSKPPTKPNKPDKT